MTAAAQRTVTFERLTCTAPAPRTDRMAEVVLQHVSAERTVRVLDLGCGTGGLIFRLARALPRAECVGIDVSHANIKAAEADRLNREEGSRVRFQAVDYLSWPAEPFDVIVIDGVLHLIACDTGALVAKLAHDLAPSGLMINAMPYDCAYNRAFGVIRKGLRSIRGSWSDRIILAVGRLLHGEMSPDLLRERVHYMYLAPERLMGEDFLRQLANRGVDYVTAYPMASTSAAQLRHSVTVFRKRVI